METGQNANLMGMNTRTIFTADTVNGKRLKAERSEKWVKEAIIQYNDTPSGGHLAISWKPLIRCKDCKKRGFDDCPVNGWMPNKADGDWFCSDGEQKEVSE